MALYVHSKKTKTKKYLYNTTQQITTLLLFVGNRFKQEKPFTILRTKQKQLQAQRSRFKQFHLLVSLATVTDNSTHNFIFVHKQPRRVGTTKKQTFHRFWHQGEKGRVEEHVLARGC